jgi:hypothetical protein
MSDLNNVNPISGDANPVVGNSDASHVAVVVNLRAAINASANVAVFGPSEESVENVIWCDGHLDVSGLYSDPSNALIEFWEPSNERGTIKARIAKDTRNARHIAQVFSESLADVIKSGMDASAANPFQMYPSGYHHYDNFGELALSYAAEGMFGHPSATVAITNDKIIVDGFNNDISASDPVTSAVPASQTNQALAQRIAAALFDSSEPIATAIAQVVLGQDARRATNEDNSALQLDRKAPLRFYHGDVVYVKITLENWTASNGNDAAGFLNQAFQPTMPPKQDYYLRINVTTGGQ